MYQKLPGSPNPKGPSWNAGWHQPYEVQGTWSTAAKKGITDLHTKSWMCLSYFREAHLRVTISSLVCILGLFFEVIFYHGIHHHEKPTIFGGRFERAANPSMAIQQIQVMYSQFYIWGFPWWYPTTIGFPTKNDHFWVFWYHHLDEFMTLTSMWSSCLNMGKLFF